MIPTDPHLILTEFSRRRLYILLKVIGVKIEAVDLLGRVIYFRTAELPQQRVGKTDIAGQDKEFTLYPLVGLYFFWYNLMYIYHNIFVCHSWKFFVSRFQRQQFLLIVVLQEYLLIQLRNLDSAHIR